MSEGPFSNEVVTYLICTVGVLQLAEVGQLLSYGFLFAFTGIAGLALYSEYTTDNE